MIKLQLDISAIRYLRRINIAGTIIQMACVLIKWWGVVYSTLSIWSCQAAVVSMTLRAEVPGQHQSSISRPKRQEDFPVEEECGGLSLFCLGRVGHSILQCPAWPQFGLCPGNRQGIGAVFHSGYNYQNTDGVIVTVPIIFMETLGIPVRIWESLSIIVSLNIIKAIFNRSLTSLKIIIY